MTGQREVRQISAISSCCTSRYVDGDDITRLPLGAKNLWLISVRQRTKWISSKVRDVDGSSAPFVIALKNNITNRMPKFISFCNKHKHVHFLSTVHSSIYWMNFCAFPIMQVCGGGIEVMAGGVVNPFISISITYQNYKLKPFNWETKYADLDCIFTIIVILYWEISVLPVHFNSIFVEANWKILNCRLDFRFQRKHNFGFCDILPGNKKYTIPGIFSSILFRI